MSIDWRVEVVGSVESTQNVAHNKAIGGEEEGYVFQALQQSNGRGRHGNKWIAPMGNLYFSAVLRPKSSLNESGQLSFVVAVALSKTLDNYIDATKHQKTLKWPNDILVDGLKISGILLESNLKADGGVDSIVLGVGVNIFKAPELAVSLQDVANKPVYINVFRDEFLENLSEIYELWNKKGFAPIRKEWLKQAHGLNEKMSVRLPNEIFKGEFNGVNDNGALLVLLEDGSQRVVQAGEVHFGNDI